MVIKLKGVFLIVVSFFSPAFSGESFDHDIEYEHDSGDLFLLKSKGKFVDIVDFDEVVSIKRLLCRHGLIMIAMKDDDVELDWHAGQILLGSAKWKCLNTGHTPRGSGIYTRIKQIVKPRDGRIDIVTEPVGPFDLLDEANIHLQYRKYDAHSRQKGQDSSRSNRKKRYSSNILSNMLNHINWTANIDLTVPNNYNVSAGNVQNKFMLERFYGMSDLIYWDRNDEITDHSRGDFSKMMIPMWKWDCPNCSGLTNFSYIFELVIYKINNKPVIKKYLSQIEAISQVHVESRMHFSRESALKGSRLLWARPETEMFRVPLAVARNVPPVELVVTTNDVVMAQVHGYVAGETDINIGFNMTGKFSLSQNFASQQKAKGDASFQDWQLHEKSFAIEAPSKVNVTASIMQTIVFNASVHWSGKDVSAILSPPAVMTVKPEVKIQTNFKELSREYNCTVNVIADLRMSKAIFVVEAFGLHIWNVLLAEGFEQKLRFFNDTVGTSRLSNCNARYTNIGASKSMEETCGPMLEKVSTNEKSKKLSRLIGGRIYATNEYNVTVPCTMNSSHDKCYVSSSLAYAIVRLLRYIEEEMPKRNLIIIRGFEDFTSKKYGESSLFYEGRAAEITLTEASANKSTSDTRIVNRLGQLAICSGINYVYVIQSKNTVMIAVSISEENENCTDTNSGDHCFFAEAMSFADTNATVNARHRGIPHEFQLGETYPQNQSVLNVCGPPLFPMSRFTIGVSNRLYFYKDIDVEFQEDIYHRNWCGHPVRLCKSCQVSAPNMWDRCSVRLMSPKASLSLKRLKTLVKEESASSKITILKAFVEDADILDPILDNGDLLFRDGRGLTMTINGSLTASRLATLAVKAGFDFVEYKQNNLVQVFVKNQENFMSRISFFPSGVVMHGVLPSNMLDEVEYVLLKAHRDEPRQPLLLDGFNPTTKLSDFYSIEDFLAPDFRFFRLDETLLHCLDMVSEDLGEKVEIIPGSAYRVRSLNLNNIDIRNKNERFRFQLGQAVEIRMKNNRTVSSLVELGKTVMRTCTSVARPQHRAIGLGCHSDRLYVDIHPLPLGQEDKYLKVWNSGGQILYLELMSRAYTSLIGGPIISPLVKKTACFAPIGNDFTHLSFQMKKPAMCTNTNEEYFCSSTKEYRRQESLKLQERMSSAAGADNLPQRDILPEIERCVVEACGGCIGSGPTWDRKVRACARMVRKYTDRASRPFQKLNDKVTFYNTENVESSVHSLACHFGFICVENVQLYSLFMPLITSTYNPDRDKSVEEKLFPTERNPSPLLELVSQELAFRAIGTVRVFIDNNRDIMVLRNVLKVLMVYNKNVTSVEFHLAENIKQEDVKASLQRKLESWSSSSCPDWSRFAVVPYSVHVIPQHRRKRSIELSVPRNHARIAFNNKEIEWLRKL